MKGFWSSGFQSDGAGQKAPPPPVGNRVNLRSVQNINHFLLSSTQNTIRQFRFSDAILFTSPVGLFGFVARYV